MAVRSEVRYLLVAQPFKPLAASLSGLPSPVLGNLATFSLLTSCPSLAGPIPSWTWPRHESLAWFVCAILMLRTCVIGSLVRSIRTAVQRHEAWVHQVSINAADTAHRQKAKSNETQSSSPLTSHDIPSPTNIGSPPPSSHTNNTNAKIPGQGTRHVVDCGTRSSSTTSYVDGLLIVTCR
ncbi:uncharacterized protein F5Z01DRAFT_417938 [Emericellopsis atlantica]|uniref:Uncharacterized protein n=1 Tax=Emericellopsis atlantica TaxID=2614577 RepID=A0A9P8CKQ7_9HYPO|nr:uncharacterized protein F5Z01DRAFT_417938 [Emericellopsis atlantica]KAG9250200.1 hypothetical protein F5Z01DRAFT_417938 [Emericellopsis atlantica]